MSKPIVKPVALAVCTAFVGSVALSSCAFAMSDLSAGYLLAAQDSMSAQDDKMMDDEKMRPSFDAMDSDKSGTISQAEYGAAHGGDTANFSGRDTNADGSIDRAELDAAHAGMKGKEGSCGEGKCGEGKCGGEKK